ncbi:MAG TPA: UDP-2,3-diacylglucosamine diphosphatase [Rhizobacter sp.]|jgi:UDP-2,3-diacylglucosamine hydrolase|nr:UDP-2,3-diacylglucosamine diphosphatase [Rhizobacter sp.]
MLAEVLAPPQWRSIDFISDLHLAVDTPLTFEAWAAYLSGTPADAVFILGDLFEVWVGDDARFDGFEARCAQVLAEAARRRHVSFMVGNRDFLVGADMLAACGVTALADPCVLAAFGQRVLLTHGDELCIGDTAYQEFRSMVRNPAWQVKFLAQPLEARQRFAREARTHSEMRKKDLPSPADWADIDPAMAVDWLHRAHTTTMIHGHTHRPASESLGQNRVRHVLSDWDLDHQPPRAEVLRFSAAGLTRLPLSDAL